MPSNYTYENDALCRFGSYEKFNRVLYGGHDGDVTQSRFFTFAGDTPIFMGSVSDFMKDTWCYQAKQGVLMTGLALTEGYSQMSSHDDYSKWLHECSDIVTQWHHGYMTYDLARFSPYFPDVKLHIEAYPLNPRNGYVIHYDFTTEQRLIFTAGFGGVTPFFGRFEYHTSQRRDFSPEDCKDNTAEIQGSSACISGPNKAMLRIMADFQCEYSLDAPDAMMEAYPAQFLTPHKGQKRIVKLKRIVNAGEHFSGNIIVLQNENLETLQTLAADQELLRKLRSRIREKYASVTFNTPDQGLNASVPDTMIALDASFHGNSFYHGAIGYHAPFLGWRGWYAPTLLGWEDRVRKAINSHFATITRTKAPEKVWWDGADRPDLDHEGTQYHHLLNSPGHLTALLHRDDIYDMQEVALDMTLFYLENTADKKTAADIYDRILEILDWEERILDPDGDGLYQNFLNTWISDGHCYDGAGCAQASAYNYSANLRTANIGYQLGKDVSKLIARARKIQSAMQSKLWLEETGVLAESIDTIGNKMVHPSPELSTTYLAIDCDAINPMQAWRALKWTERNIKSITTIGRGGKLFHSANWLPKKYSTDGIFPAENACLALAYYQNEQPEKAFDILKGLADAFALSPHPGSITHVLSAQGGTDDGDIDFTDVSSCYLRTLVEGLWGIRVDGKKVFVGPQLPEDWTQADISLPRIAVNFHRTAYSENLTLDVQNEATILRLPMRFAEIDQVLVDGRDAKYCILQGFGRTYVEIAEIKGGKHNVKVFYNNAPFPALLHNTLTVFPGNLVSVDVTCGEIEAIDAPENAMEILGKNGSQWIIRIKKTSSFDCFVYVGNAILPLEFTVPPSSASQDVTVPENQKQVPMAKFFNASICNIHKQKFLSPRPEGYSIGMRLNGRYAWEWNHYGHNAVHVDDSILRATKGKFTLKSGWMFNTPAKGNNALCVSLWDNFPTSVDIPLSGKANALAVLLCGTTNAMQLYVPNARLEVIYSDESQVSVDLLPPKNFDDFLHPVYQSQNESAYIGEGTHALVQTFRLNPEKPLRTLRITALANEAIINILGVTLG